MTTPCGTRVSATVAAGHMTVAVSPAPDDRTAASLVARLCGLDAPVAVARGAGGLVVVDVGASHPATPT